MRLVNRWSFVNQQRWTASASSQLLRLSYVERPSLLHSPLSQSLLSTGAILCCSCRMISCAVSASTWVPSAFFASAHIRVQSFFTREFARARQRRCSGYISRSRSFSSRRRLSVCGIVLVPRSSRSVVSAIRVHSRRADRSLVHGAYRVNTPCMFWRSIPCESALVLLLSPKLENACRAPQTDSYGVS